MQIKSSQFWELSLPLSQVMTSGVGSVTSNASEVKRFTANEVAAQNRLTVTVKVSFTNRKYPEDDFENKTFSAYSDYDSNNSLDAVESSLCAEIVDKLIEDIFNATVANW